MFLWRTEIMTNSIRIQHYVPRFYLQNFSNKQRDAFLINCFDKTSQKIFRVNIENVAAESSFYDTDKYTNQLVEKSLGRHESEFNEAHRKLLKVKNYRALKKKEMTSLLFFMSSQEIRTREMRESLKDMVQQIHKRLSRERLSDGLREQIEEARTDAAIKDLHVRVLVQDVPKFVAIMAQMKWVLMQNRTSMPFWTSDHPVNRFNPVVHKPYGSLGLVKTGINIYFPLSPSLVLCLCDPIFYRMLPDKVDVTNEAEATFQHHLQETYSTRHLFSPTNDFALAKKMISENADLGDVTRKRHDVT